MQQRVAIARALAYQPTILLMDEPFASVDAQTRADLEDLVLRGPRSDYDVTIVFVTHDIDESVYLSDRIVVLTPSPTAVRRCSTSPLPRPRDQVATKELPEFAHLRAHVWRSIKRPDEAEVGVGELILPPAYRDDVRVASGARLPGLPVDARCAHPSQPLVAAPQTLTELTGPLLGEGRVRPVGRRPHAPARGRAARRADHRARARAGGGRAPGARHARRGVAVQQRRSLPARRRPPSRAARPELHRARAAA